MAHSRSLSFHSRKWLRVIVAVAGGAGATFVLAAFILAAFGLCDHLSDCEVALILGSAPLPDGTVSPHLRAELDRTLGLRRLGYFDQVIVSAGGGGADEMPTPNPTLMMRDYLVAHGVPEDAIIVDRGGINLAASARDAVLIMREQRWDGICVVTEFYRVARARLALSRYGAHDIWSVPAGAPARGDALSAAREVIAYAQAWCRHYDHIPGARKSPDGL